MHAERGGCVGDGDCLTSVLERIPNERNDAWRDERSNRLEHVFRAAMLLRRRDDRAQRDAHVVHAAQHEIVHAGAGEGEDLSR